MKRMLAHLWTGAPAPPAYVELTMCRLYNCPPSVLDQQDTMRVLRHLTCLRAESIVDKARRSRKQRSK